MNMKRFAAVIALIIGALCLSSCKQQEEAVDYSHLVTDIVGVWCDPEGPEFVAATEERPAYYRLYEFTSDGRQINHQCSQETGSGFHEHTYTITDDILTVDSTMQCRIKIEDGILTMITNDHETQYKRASDEELYDSGCIPVDTGTYNAYVDYMSRRDTEEGNTVDPSQFGFDVNPEDYATGTAASQDEAQAADSVTE